MRYVGAVYRPPSEAASLIIQLTIGCARNTCTFCSMYKEKKFSIRPFSEVVEDMEMAKEYYGDKVKRLFLADGDALIVKNETLLEVLAKAWEIFPALSRISIYGAPMDILHKTPEELAALKDAGLSLVYMGVESGSDTILKKVKKGVTQAQMIEAGRKLKAAGMGVSMTLISGLGGREFWQENARESAYVTSQIKPDYVSLLTLMVESDVPLYDEIQAGSFTLSSPEQIAEEMELYLRHVDSEGTIFRSNHASNYVSLAGTLNQDIPAMLEKISSARQKQTYKPEYYRGF